MHQRFARIVYHLRLPFVLGVLFIATMTSLPAPSHASVGCPARACLYDYYYDAAHTQFAGQCQEACYAGGQYCTGEVTEYSVRTGCDPCPCGSGLN
jgi:hypothetical protein